MAHSRWGRKPMVIRAFPESSGRRFEFKLGRSVYWRSFEGFVLPMPGGPGQTAERTVCGAPNACRVGALVAVAVWGAAAVRAQTAPAGPVLTPADYVDESALAELLWQRSPEVLEARTAAGTAASEVTRAGLYPNPQLDFTWGTIPVGRTNPPHLDDALDHVPNYTGGLSELIEIAKRGPRQAATVAELQRARAQALSALAQRFFELLGAVGHIAKAQLRVAVTTELVQASAELLELDRVRAAKGDLAAIDLDRAEVEHLHLVASRDAAATDLEEARAACGTMVGRPCTAFESTKATRGFIEPAIAAALPATWSDDAERRRPDIAALDATLEAATQRRVLGERRAIPDVTARVGYTYDSFVASGNQRNSLAVGVQVPLPVLDQGQADVAAATATLVRAQQTRQSLVEAGRLSLESAAHRRELLNQRLEHLELALGKARGVRDAMVAAQRRGGASMIDVLLARRAYEELLLDRVDLLGDAYETTLKIRQSAALFPHPRERAEGGGP